MKALLLSALLAISAGAPANNIVVSNTALGAQDPGNQTLAITFNVAWENSWRTSSNEANHDGAWLFVKFRKAGTYDWRHCTLDPISTPANGAVLSVSPDSKGAFIHRAADGIGNVSYSGNQLIWQYGTDGVLNNDSVEVRVFALEMVYIPEGPYYLGSGGSETLCFRDGSSTMPFLVAGPGALTTGTTAGLLNLNGAGTNGTVIPATYPNGYVGFWIMKYECSRQQFADFLNLLNSAQAATHQTSTGIFTGSSHPNFTPLVPDRAYGDLGAAQLFAFADWSGLRPYSELEFEKACRGKNILPVPNEYPWGTTGIVQMTSALFTDEGLPTEAVQIGSLANAAYRNSNGTGGPGHPVRVGMFARTTGANRQLCGATYYGVMNMADNMLELTVRSGTSFGQSIDAAVHGDGYLTTTIATWQAAALGIRGSHWNSPAGSLGDLRLSDRSNSHVNLGATSTAYGIRLARTAY